MRQPGSNFHQTHESNKAIRNSIAYHVPGGGGGFAFNWFEQTLKARLHQAFAFASLIDTNDGCKRFLHQIIQKNANTNARCKQAFKPALTVFDVCAESPTPSFCSSGRCTCSVGRVGSIFAPRCRPCFTLVSLRCLGNQPI